MASLKRAVAGTANERPASAMPSAEPGRSRLGRLRVAASTPRAQTAGAALLYIAYALWVTWPVALHLDTRIYGAVPGDIAGAIAYSREVVEHGVFPFAPARLTDFDAPAGLPVQWVLNVTALPGTALLVGMAAVFGATAGHTLYTLAGYVASGLAMFLLARRVSGSASAALVAGFAFAFYPFAVNKGLGHLHFVHGWPLVLLVWRMLELAQVPGRRNALLAGAAIAFAMWFTPYYMLIAAVAACVLGVVVLVVGWSARRLRAAAAGLAVAAAVPVALVLALGVLSIASASAEVGRARSHPLSQLTAFSARAHEFLVPDRNNLLLDTGSYLSARLHSSNFSESSLYVGWTVILLAAAAAALAALDVRRLGRAALVRIRGSAALTGVLLAVCGVAFAAPPQLTVAGRLIPMPSWFIHHVSGTWRVYSRFVVLVILGLALLAALAIAAWSRSSPRRSAAVIGLLLPLVAVDLWARPPDAVTALSTPPMYEKLRSLGPGIVAEYPLLPAAVPDASAIFYQQAGGHPIFNGYAEGSRSESRKLELVDLGDRETAPDLAAWGVRWIVVRPAYGGGAPGAGYQRVYEGPDGSIYRVTAEPARTGVDAITDSFSPIEGVANEHHRWLSYDEGRLYVWGDCDPCRGQLRFDSSSQNRARELTVLDGGGRVLHRQSIPPTPVTVRVPLEFRRSTELLLRIDPPGEPVAVPGSTDTRQLGIIVAEPRFTLGDGD